MNIVDLREQRKEEEEAAIIPAISEREATIKSGASYIWETVKIIIIALAIIIPIRLYVVQPFIVEGDSMIPNYHDGEYLIVDEISYRFNEPARGEVVIFHPPNDPKTYYIKRVVGLPNETIELKDGQIYLYNEEFKNSVLVSESNYLPSSNINEEMRVTLTEGQYFVLGDNRQNSLDSRRFGPITLDYVKGRAILRAFPFADFSLLEKPDYSF